MSDNVSMMSRDDAMKHVVNSTRTWSTDGGKVDATQPRIRAAFNMAIDHVRTYHYNLSDDDVLAARGMVSKPKKAPVMVKMTPELRRILEEKCCEEPCDSCQCGCSDVRSKCADWRDYEFAMKTLGKIQKG